MNHFFVVEIYFIKKFDVVISVRNRLFRDKISKLNRRNNFMKYVCHTFERENDCDNQIVSYNVRVE